jgi:hypothetical protein
MQLNSMLQLGNKGVAEDTTGVDPIVFGFVPQQEFDALLSLSFPTLWYAPFVASEPRGAHADIVWHGTVGWLRRLRH